MVALVARYATPPAIATQRILHTVRYLPWA